MPLSTPEPRQLQHQRRVQCLGYLREDGLFDIEGRMTDVKTYAFANEYRGGILQAGEPLHDLWIRLTIDRDFLIHDVEACTDGSPFHLCPSIASRYRQLIGVSIGTGWSAKLRALFGGVKGCTHMTELLGPVATTAFQTVFGLQYNQQDAKPPTERETPTILNTCHAMASDSPVVKRRWPRAYTGSDRDHGGRTG